MRVKARRRGSVLGSLALGGGMRLWLALACPAIVGCDGDGGPPATDSAPADALDSATLQDLPAPPDGAAPDLVSLRDPGLADHASDAGDDARREDGRGPRDGEGAEDVLRDAAEDVIDADDVADLWSPRDLPGDLDAWDTPDTPDAPDTADAVDPDALPDVTDVSAPPDTSEVGDDGPDVVGCPQGPFDPRCDDGQFCTFDRCDEELGRCVHESRDGAACPGPVGCGLGACYEGRCLDFPLCDDGHVCTADDCEAGGICSSEPTGALGRRAPAFSLEDVNPYSADFGAVFSLAELAGTVVVLVFQPTACVPCWDHSEAAREVYGDFAEEPDLLFATIDVHSETQNIEDYATHDIDGVPPLVSVWPILQDVEEQGIWLRYCADTYQVAVIGRDGHISYYRVVNFLDGPFRQELRRAIEAALARQ